MDAAAGDHDGVASELQISSAGTKNSEVDFLASESVDQMVSGIVAIRARVSDDVDDEDVEDEGDDRSLASSEVYDSASERVAMDSTHDMESPVGSFTEFLPLSDATQLNESNSRVPSVDVYGDNGIVMPVAKPTVEDGDDADVLDDDDDEDADGSPAESESVALEEEQLTESDLLSYSAHGLPVRGEFVSEEQEYSSLAPPEEQKSQLSTDEGFILKQPEILDAIHKEDIFVNDQDSGIMDSETDHKEGIPDAAESKTTSANAVFSTADSFVEDSPLAENKSDEDLRQSDASDLNPKFLTFSVEDDVASKQDQSPHSQGDNWLIQGEHEPNEKDDSVNVEEKNSGTIIETRQVEEVLIAAHEDDDDGGDDDDDDDDDGDVADNEETSVAASYSLLDALLSSKSSEARTTDMPSLAGAGPSLPARPAGLGRAMPSLEHGPRPVQRSSGSSVPSSTTPSEPGESKSNLSGGEEAQKKLQNIRVKFLRLAHRLGQSANNVVVAQVLYRLGLAEQLRSGPSNSRAGAFSFERASALAEEQEAAKPDDLEFGCTIMVLGKSGVGKSATVNSLFDECKTITDAYNPATKKVQVITGTIHGIKLKVIDTPGLLPSFSDQRHNEKIMSSVKRFIKKSPPDIVLYFDRLDVPSRDYGDLQLLRTITDTFGAAIWFNAIVVLTHASSAPPDGANGVPVSYEMFVAQRTHVVQQTIRQAAGDMRLMNPVSLVENHVACRRNRAGERVLPNGHVWKPQLLLLCFASKILAEANSLLKLQDNSPIKPFGVRQRVPPLPFLLSSLLQSRAQLKLPDEQMDDDISYSDEETDSDDDEDYDDLPPFRNLTRAELALLDKEQKQTYREELAYREKLFMKKQLKEERARKRELKRRLDALPKETLDYVDQEFEEENGPGAVPVLMPDMALPPSFDSDNPTYRYRYLDTANQWLVRPVLETHGWDHDSGYDGLNIEKTFLISKKIPASLSGQVTKDKKEATVQMECNAAFKNGDGKVTLTGFDMQTIGKDLAYTLRGETRFDNFKRSRTSCGLAITMLGNAISAGMKLEERLMIGRQCKLVANAGALTGRGDVAYGGSLEASLKHKDYPIEQTFSTLGLSVMNWHGDLAIGGNFQLQFKLGQTLIGVRTNLNNRGSGQLTIRANSSEQLQMALIGLLPLLQTCMRRISGSEKTM